MNISRTIKESVGLITILAATLFFVSFIGTASAGHGNMPGCTPAPTNQSEYGACLAAISDACNQLDVQQQLMGGPPFDLAGCITTRSSDVQIIAPTAPAAPTNSGPASLINPLGGIPNVQTLFQSVMTAFIIISVPFIVFFIILAGFQYVTAQGSPEKIKSASKALLYAIIGAVIIVGAIAITTIVGNTVVQFGS